MSTAIQPVQPAGGIIPRSTPHLDLPDTQTWQTIVSMGKALYDSGMLPNSIKSAQGAVAIILKGRELGLPAMYALQNINVIEGSPTANAQTIAALIYRDHGDGALVPVESTRERATYQYKRRSWPGYRTFSYTIEDAKTANLMGKKNWRENPAAMLRARCVSAIGRLAFQDTVGGLYTPEELGSEEIGDEVAFTVTPEPDTDEHDVQALQHFRETVPALQPNEREVLVPTIQPAATTETAYSGSDDDLSPTDEQPAAHDRPEFTWNDFWKWARSREEHPFVRMSEVEDFLGFSWAAMREMAPREVRDHILAKEAANA